MVKTYEGKESSIPELQQALLIVTPNIHTFIKEERKRKKIYPFMKFLSLSILE